LIRIRASPLGDTRAIAFHRWASGIARGLESPQYRFGGSICRPIDSRVTPNHRALQPCTRRLSSTARSSSRSH
jgi:hypothetical protein